MHEINIHTQRSDKYENKLGSVNRMRKTIFDRKFYVISLNDHISKVDLSENKISTNYLINSQTTTHVDYVRYFK